MSLKLPLSIALLLSLGSAARADVELARIFASHMVIQRDTELVVFGTAAPGEGVSVEGSWGVKAGPVAAGADGRFEVVLRTPAAGGPHQLVVRGSNTVTLDDVWSGDVWLCSGQSNMEWLLDWVAAANNEHGDAAAELAGAALPGIRLFTVPNEIAYAPRRTVGGEWRVCSPETAKEFSAVGYYFGKRLHEALGVPIGLISSDWGGTVCEAWASAEALKAHGGFDEGLARIAELAGAPGATAGRYDAALAEWWQAVEAKEPGSGELTRARERLNYDAWPKLAVPGEWSAVLGDHDGVVWLRRMIVVPPKYSSGALRFRLGPIDDMDTFYFNGTRVDGGERPGLWSTPREYVVPAKLVRAGQNQIAIRVVDTGGYGGLTGKAEDIGFRSDDETAPKVQPLAGQWSYYKGAALSEFPPLPAPPDANPNQPSVLYNAMIAPLVPFALRGAIWYQGESNRGRALQYRTLFPAMIADWRARFRRPELPFYFVQIAPFRYGDAIGAAAEIRDAQRRALATPHTGMAVTMDIGDLADIHPKNKKEVGARLARWALSKTYGKRDVVASGPLARAMKVDGATVVVEFDYADGLTTRGASNSNAGELSGFELAGADGQFFPAEAALAGATVHVRSSAVPAPVRVRFLHGDTAVATLFNAAGLPASPFELP
ncbi:MAG: sialate O-acetylesterase [Planctomycetes bacterium]|nr:sialate O-acetylesterase [Planctomycetota bacterium]